MGLMDGFDKRLEPGMNILLNRCGSNDQHKCVEAASATTPSAESAES